MMPIDRQSRVVLGGPPELQIVAPASRHWERLHVEASQRGCDNLTRVDFVP